MKARNRDERRFQATKRDLAKTLLLFRGTIDRIAGVQHYLRRAVDRHGVVLDILVQPQPPQGLGAA